MSEPHWTPFDIADGWSPGTTVLEASAGTGKTWTIAALATRYVADGHGKLDDLLLVTFGRSASLELRERVRGQLAQAHRWLSGVVDSDVDGPLHRLLSAGGEDTLGQRRDRLATALAGFDGATIATTHTFCSRMLAGLGLAGDHDARAELREDLAELGTQVVGDTYLHRYAGEQRPRLGFVDAEAVARAVLARPGSRIEPATADPWSSDAHSVEFARQVVRTMAQRKRRAAVMEYDDLQGLLRDALADPVSGPLAVRLLQRRYRVVMVDEFQDTDPVQWEILRRAFHEASGPRARIEPGGAHQRSAAVAGNTDLILIGDPKQAIYAFRGGDVVTYLQATGSAHHHLTLPTNWRADRPLVAALQLLLGDLALGDPRIVVRPVAAVRQSSRVQGAGAAVRIRQVTWGALGVAGRQLPTVGVTRPFVFADLASDISRLLTGAATLEATVGGRRSVQPGDIAVLVERNEWGAQIRTALADLGIPAVDTATRSVFATPAAGHWRTLLEALDAPHRSTLARAALLGPFVGWTAQQLATAADAEGAPADDEPAQAAAADLDRATTRLGEWATLLRDRGVAAAFDTISVATRLPARLLARPGGERLLTDLRHVAEILHTAARDEQLGLAGMIGWLRRRVEEAGRDQNTDRARRLDSDAHAVQITTIHRAKGLEFPVVYLPGASDRFVSSSPYPLYLHDDHGDRVIDVSAQPGDNQQAQHHEEDAGEDLRKLYVGLTRASSQVVTWWVPSTNTRTSALHRLLFADRLLQGGLAHFAAVPSDQEVAERLGELAASSHGTIEVELVTEPAPGRRVPEHASTADLDARVFNRSLDNGWRRTSYTGLTAAAHAARSLAASAASESEERTVTDEPEPGGARATEAELLRAAAGGPVTTEERAAEQCASPMDGLPGGASLGTLVHEVLEVFDPDASDARGELHSRCEQVLARRGGDLTAAELSEALLPSLQTPMYGLPGAPAFVEIARRDLLREADFEMPLAGGDLGGRAGAVLSDIADVLAARLPDGDRLAGYPDRLRDLTSSAGAELRGYLTGSIDAVARLHTEHGPRFVVIDYKTNRLGAGPLTAWHYRPAAVAEAMMDAHYPLQALLYSVALHRFLRWRQPGYAPGTHLGPIAYTFLRGMCGPATPVLDGQTCGVFCWQPPAGLVPVLSDLLSGRRA